VNRDPELPENICCYIVQCADGTLYTGWTADIGRRVRDHNAGRGGRYTRARRPVNLIYTEPQPDARTARRREAALKRLRREAKLALAGAPDEPSAN
jgi:putative endonuclease